MGIIFSSIFFFLFLYYCLVFCNYFCIIVGFKSQILMASLCIFWEKGEIYNIIRLLGEVYNFSLLISFFYLFIFAPYLLVTL